MSNQADQILKNLEALKIKIQAFASAQDKLRAVRTTNLAQGTRDVTEKAAKVLADIQMHPGTVRKEIVARTKLAPLAVTKIVSELSGQEKLVKLGSRRTTRWFAPGSLDKLLK